MRIEFFNQNEGLGVSITWPFFFRYPGCARELHRVTVGFDNSGKFHVVV